MKKFSVISLDSPKCAELIAQRLQASNLWPATTFSVAPKAGEVCIFAVKQKEPSAVEVLEMNMWAKGYFQSLRDQT